MAASIYTIVLSNGQTISVYQGASQPLNSVLNVGLIGLPDANSKITDFSVMTDAYIFDIIVPATLTAGGFEIYDVTAGQRTSLGVNNLEVFTKDNMSRRVPPLGFRAGRYYRLIQSVSGNA